MDEIRVSTWSELHENLYADSWQENLGRFRSPYAFRGMPDASYDLRTTLMRLGGSYANLEGPLLRTFRRYAKRDAVPDDYIWNWLATAQHHGLPTRLLDWTYSPYVAMHFATQDVELYDRDAIIWCINYVASTQYVPDVLKQSLEEEDAYVFTAEMLNHAASTLRDFDELNEDPFVVFFEPPSLDERIINQYALFALMSDPTVRLDHWLEDHPDLARQIRIPAGLKWEIRDKLDQANITERVLFPGLDGLSRWLSRYYRPTNEECDHR